MSGHAGSQSSGILYIVATPIGNLEDMSPRAIRTLRDADLIAAEDTRHSKRLLNYFNISTHCIAFHEHNERVGVEKILQSLSEGKNIALISDAGTPLISDPGYYLVKCAQEQSIRVIPVPGPSALICALSVSGLPTDQFCFQGFIPSRQGERNTFLQALADEHRTLIFYESPHRIIESLKAMSRIFGEQRIATIARELTKTFETVRQDTLENLLDWVENDGNQQKGEFVIVVAGGEKKSLEADEQLVEKCLRRMLVELPLKQAVAMTVDITGVRKKIVYQTALTIKEELDK